MESYAACKQALLVYKVGLAKVSGNVNWTIKDGSYTGPIRRGV